MALFGPPNIDKLYQDGNVEKLITVLKNTQDPALATKACEALQELTGDEQRRQDRMTSWTFVRYDHILKRIEKLDSKEQEMIRPLIQILVAEKKDVEDKTAARDRARENLKKRFEEAFKPVLINVGSLFDVRWIFFDDLEAALGESKEFLYTKRFGGRKTGGVIVTKDKIILWEQYIFGKTTIVPISIREIDRMKYGWLKLSIKITSLDGKLIEFDIDDNDNEMISYIENCAPVQLQ